MEERVTPAAVRPDPLPLLRVLLLLAVALLVIEPGHVPLFEPDEGRYSEIPREMLETGDFVTPRLNGVLYFEKPPLFYWAVAVCQKLIPAFELASRVPSRLASAGMVLLVFLFARKRWGERVALLAALILATSGLVFALSRIAIIDPSLSFAMSASFLAFAAYQEHEGKDERRARGALFGLHAACAAAVMLKGLIGLVLPGGAILVFCAVTGRWRLVPRLFSPLPLALFLLLTVPWHVLVARENPSFLDFYFVHEHFARFAAKGHRREGSPFFFVGVLLGGFLPWTGFFGRLAATWPGRARAAWRERGVEAFLWISSLVVFLFFSVSKSKLIPYLEPIWPAMAVLLALGIERAREKGARFGVDLAISSALSGALLVAGSAYAFGAGYAARFGIAGAAAVVLAALAAGALLPLLPVRGLVATRVAAPFLLFLAAALAAFGPVARAVTPWPLVSAMLRELTPGTVLLQRGHFLEAAPAYAKRLTPIVALEWSELNFGQREASPELRERLFPSEERFVALWNGPDKVLLVVHRAHLKLWARGHLKPFRMIATWGSKKHYLVANR